MKLPELPKSFGVSLDEVLESRQEGKDVWEYAEDINKPVQELAIYLQKCSDTQLKQMLAVFSSRIETKDTTPGLEEAVTFLHRAIEFRDKRRKIDQSVVHVFDLIKHLQEQKDE